MEAATAERHFEQEDSENVWPQSMNGFNLTKLRSFDEADDWINEVDVSRFSSEVFPDLKTYSYKRPNQMESNPGLIKFPKPSWSYSCLIGLALKNSSSGQLTVSEIYAFMCENFPYFRTAPPGWKNSVRHNLSLNKCFEKIEVESDSQGRKSCLWSIRADKIDKMELDFKKWKERDQGAIFEGMARPQDLKAIEEGRHGMAGTSKDTQLEHKLIKLEPESMEFVVKQEPIEDASTSQRPPRSEHPKLPAILSRHTIKKSIVSTNRHISPAKISSALVKVAPPRCHTPTKRPRLDLLTASPLHSLPNTSDYDAASAALTDNSLLNVSLGQSPYKGPISFPPALSL